MKPKVGFWRADREHNILQRLVDMVMTPVGILNVVPEIAGLLMLTKNWPDHPGFIRVGTEIETVLLVVNPIPG